MHSRITKTIVIALALLALAAAPAGAYDVTPLNVNGNGSTDTAISPDGTTLLISRNSGGALERVDLSSFSTQSRITLTGSTPEGIAFTSSGSDAYVTTSYTGELSRVSTATWTETTHAAVANQPVDVAIDAMANYAYVVRKSSSSPSGVVSRLTIGTGTDTTYTVGQYPIAIQLDPTETFAYVVNSGSDSLSRIRLSNGTVTPLALTGCSTPLAIAIDGAGTYGYVACRDSNTVVRITLSSYTQSGSVAVAGGPRRVALVPNFPALLVTQFGSDAVASINTDTFTAITSTVNLPASSAPWGVSVDADGTYAYVSAYGDGYVYRVRLGPGAPTALSATNGDASTTINFTAGPDNGSPITSYQYAIDDGAWTAAIGMGPITITGLANGVSYNVRVRAINAQGAGTPSSAVVVAPVKQAEGGSGGTSSASSASSSATTVTAAIRLASARATRAAIVSTYGAPSAGTVTQSGVVITAARAGRAKTVRACSASMRVKAAGTIKLSCTLTKQARALRRRAAISVLLTTTFTPTSGAPLTGSQTVRASRT